MTQSNDGTRREWLHVVIIVTLAAYLIIGIIAWVWMLVVGIEVPDAFATVLAAIIGAFAGVLSPVRRTSPTPQDPKRSRDAPPPAARG